MANQNFLKKLVLCWECLVQNTQKLCAHQELKSAQNTLSRVKLLIRSTMLWVLFARLCLNVFSNGLSKLSIVLFQQNFQDPSSSVFSILPVLKSSNSTPSNNFVSTSPTKSSNNSSTITCSFLNRKNIKKKVLNGK